MGWQQYYSLPNLLNAGKKRAENCHTVSFDLFDTLLVRRIHDPDMVKLPVARFISAKARFQGRNISWQKVQNIRDTVEKKHRKETGKHFVDFEACYPRFMEETLQEVFARGDVSALLQEVTDVEIAMENTMLVPRGDMVRWLEELGGQGKNIFIVSDVYLPAELLKRLIDHAGFLPYVTDVLSSADSFLAKASGKAFPLIQKQFGLEKKGWLHVGDNPISDGLRPSEFGIEALVLSDASEKRRKAIVKRQVNYGAGRPFWRGRALQQLMLPLEEENVEQHPLYIEGYNFLAPLLAGFVQQIAERCRDLNISKVFFLSREGWTFKKIWEQITPILFPDDNLPVIEYLYVSRMALAGASCAYQGLTRTNADISFLPVGNRDFRDICRIFSLNPETLVEHLRKYELDADTVLSPHHDGFVPKNRLRFNELLEDGQFQDAIREQVASANDALQLYLQDVGFFDQEDVALVDIGWLGTIQRFFYEAIEHLDNKPRCHGFLFSATRGVPYPASPNNYIEGMVYDRNRFDLAGSSILYARDLFEEACRAPHPTLNGYRRTESGYELEFRRTDDTIGQAEQEQDNYFHPLQQGIFDGAKRFAAASALLGYSFEEYKPWFNYLLTRKLAFPKTLEVMNIRHKHHLDDFHGSNIPRSKHTKTNHQLWERSEIALRFSPLLRLRCFLRHIKDRLNE